MTARSPAAPAAAAAAWPDPAASLAESTPAPVPHEGFIELYGRHDAGEAWILCGWIARDHLGAGPIEADIVFEQGTDTGAPLVVFYERPDLGRRGLGMVVALPTLRPTLGRLLSLTLRQDGRAVQLRPTSEADECTAAAIVARAKDLIGRPVRANSDVVRLGALLALRFVGEGYLDLYGTHPASGGVFVVGWVSAAWMAHADAERSVSASFDEETVCTGALMNVLDREDVRGTGMGLVLYVPTGLTRPGALRSVRLQAGEAVAVIRPSDAVRVIPPGEAVTYFRAVVAKSDRGPARDALLELVSRAAFQGEDTIAALSDTVAIDFDEVIACPPDSLVLCGWMLAKAGAIRAIRARCDGQMVAIDLARDALAIARPDVIATFGARGFDDPRCGFILRVKLGFPMTGDAYLEIETESGEIGFKRLQRPRLDGMEAIKRLLTSADMQYADVDAIHDRVLGPPIVALNAARLRTPPDVGRSAWGVQPARPRASVIVPLYGRVDFIEYQMALFAAHGGMQDVEFIYVLDDPPRMHQTRMLCASVHARFGVPFRLLCPGRNLGFAPACALGLEDSRGEFVCFLNSDVFPRDGFWLGRLTARLDTDATLGVVGPLLLFEDGSVQHQGMAFKRLPQYGDWWFPQHPRKGWRPAGSGLVRVPAITGACMVLRRSDALACGGFDPAYVIGDFEDSDLCFRLAERGLQAAVDLDVSLYHLERKSQAGSGHIWRSNLTLFNAWIHQRRWAARIERDAP